MILTAPFVPFTTRPIASAYAAASPVLASLIATPFGAFTVTVVFLSSDGFTVDGLILK